MFTGIINDLGRVRAVMTEGDTRLEISTAFAVADIDLGASIACSGVCLTVIDTGSGGGADWFAAQASAETLSLTTLGAWTEGTAVNLERALKVGDELGGHMVSGHVDGVGHLTARAPEGDSLRLVFEAPQGLSRFIAAKGSISVDGVSLTVNEVNTTRFGVNIIPHTQKFTTLGKLAVGDAVNLEIDMLARYVARLHEQSEPSL